MRKSVLIAGAVAVVVAGWIVSGQFSDRDSSGAKVANAETSDAESSGPAAPGSAATMAAASAASRLPSVRVREVFAEEWIDEISLFGRTEANRKVQLRVETKGRVVKHHVQKGDQVAKGAPILSLSMDDREARLEEAKASLGHAEIAFDAAKKLAQKEFRSAVQLAEANAELQRAKSALESIKLDIARTHIPAPFGGVIEELPFEIGDYAQVGDIVAELIDLDPIKVVAEISERDVPRIRIGDTALARLVSGMSVNGTVRYISRIGDTATRTFRIEVELPNGDGRLVDGLTAELRVRTGSVKAHRVSPAVLTLSDRGAIGVKVVDESESVAFLPVSIVADTEEGIWLGGLPDHVTLITVGQEFVREGQKVIAVPEEGNKRS